MPRTPRQRSTARVIKVSPASPRDQVLSVAGGGGSNRRTPCSDCPWRVDATGQFSAEAFRLSASTAYDGAMNTFACHQSGTVKPAICAGFLLRNADNNIGVRIAACRGRVQGHVTDGGVPLHPSYRAMAVANGVAPDDPVLAMCRANDECSPGQRPTQGDRDD